MLTRSALRFGLRFVIHLNHELLGFENHKATDSITWVTRKIDPLYKLLSDSLRSLGIQLLGASWWISIFFAGKITSPQLVEQSPRFPGPPGLPSNHIWAPKLQWPMGDSVFPGLPPSNGVLKTPRLQRFSRSPKPPRFKSYQLENFGWLSFHMISYA